MSPFFVQVVFFNDFGSTFEASLNAYGSLCVPFVHASFLSFFIDFWSPPGRSEEEVGGTLLNRINSTLSLSLFFKNHTRVYTNSLKGFFLKPAAGSQSPAASSGRGDWNKILQMWNKKALFLMLGISFLTPVGLLGAPRESWTLCGRSCKQKPSFHQKVSPRGHCGTLLALAGQLVALSGLLFEILFVTLGRYWDPPGPKLQKDVKIDENWEPEGRREPRSIYP